MPYGTGATASGLGISGLAVSVLCVSELAASGAAGSDPGCFRIRRFRRCRFRLYRFRLCSFRRDGFRRGFGGGLRTSRNGQFYGVVIEGKRRNRRRGGPLQSFPTPSLAVAFVEEKAVVIHDVSVHSAHPGLLQLFSQQIHHVHSLRRAPRFGWAQGWRILRQPEQAHGRDNGARSSLGCPRRAE